MRIAALNFKPWPVTSALATFAGALVVVALFTTLLAGTFSPSAVAAGTVGAVVLIYLTQSGNSVLSGPWRVRAAVVTAWLASVMVSGAIATVLFE